eukprot:1142214-Pelagomonas_calceolata.AAC.4
MPSGFAGCDWKGSEQYFVLPPFIPPPGPEPTGTPKCHIWCVIVQTSHIMDNVLTKNTLQVVYANLGSGAYRSSRLLSIRHVIQDCQGLVCPTALRISKSQVCLHNSAQEVVACA